MGIPFFSGTRNPACRSLSRPLLPTVSRLMPWVVGCWGRGALRHGIAISGQTMASFSSPNETFPLPNSSALSLAVVFVDNSYKEEAIKKSRVCCPASPYAFQRECLPAPSEVLMTPRWTQGPGVGICITAGLFNPH